MLWERICDMAKEKYVAKCRKHWSVFLRRGLTALFFLLLSFVAYSSNDDQTLHKAWIAFLAIAALIILSSIVVYATEYIAITDTKLIGHRGFIHSKQLSTPISKIQNIGLSNGLFGKLLNYHTITIDNAGTGHTEFVFTHMAKAKDFANKVEELMMKK